MNKKRLKIYPGSRIGAVVAVLVGADDSDFFPGRTADSDGTTEPVIMGAVIG